MALDREKIRAAMDGLFCKEVRDGGIEEALGLIIEYGPKFGIKTDMGAGMFLAQCREEVGGEFQADKSENLNYSSEALPKLFKYFRENRLDAELYGRNEDHKAHQVAIANLCYANRLGNGDACTNEGWTFRGKGMLQLTGKSNYRAAQRIINEFAPDAGVDIMDGMDGTKEGVLSALAFWEMKELYKYPAMFREGAIDTTEAMNKITEKINKHTHSYESRVAHFEQIAPLLV